MNICLLRNTFHSSSVSVLIQSQYMHNGHVFNMTCSEPQSYRHINFIVSHKTKITKFIHTLIKVYMYVPNFLNRPNLARDAFDAAVVATFSFDTEKGASKIKYRQLFTLIVSLNHIRSNFPLKIFVTHPATDSSHKA